MRRTLSGTTAANTGNTINVGAGGMDMGAVTEGPAAGPATNPGLGAGGTGGAHWLSRVNMFSPSSSPGVPESGSPGVD